MLNVYLSGEIHTGWRDEIIQLCEKENLDIKFSSPNTDHESSDNCGVEILGAEENNFWKDNKGASINSIKTKNTEISLFEDGGIIKNIKFSTSSNRSLINTRKYSYQTAGQIFTMNKASQKFNDLIKTSIISETKNLPIRKKILCILELPFGDLTKIFYVYEDLPRIDVRYIFTFKDYNPAIFRINLINLNLNNFDNTSLCYSTNNGGNLETFSLNEPVFHDNPTNSKISSTCCLGSTNCLLDVGDKSHGITIYSNNAECYSVPMINFKKLNKSPLRLIYSICELDDKH